MAHAEAPKVLLLLLAALSAAAWWGLLSTGTSWVEAAPLLVLAGVFLAAALTVWGVQRCLEPPPEGSGEVPPPAEEPGSSLDPMRPGGR